MNFLQSPKNKVLLASAAILLLALLSPMKGATPATAARVVLGVGAIAAFAWWVMKKRSTGGELDAPARLRVLSKTGLSQRCGLALIEADGHNYLVVFGDGFAKVQQARRVAPAQGRNVDSKGGAL